MTRLPKLKGIQTYLKMSITDDYTSMQRKAIQEAVQRARERSANEPEDSNIICQSIPGPSEKMQVIFNLQFTFF